MRRARRTLLIPLTPLPRSQWWSGCGCETAAHACCGPAERDSDDKKDRKRVQYFIKSSHTRNYVIDTQRDGETDKRQTTIDL
jgi:hypothetical protein